MASTIMHIAVADQIYKKITLKNQINYYEYILGSIAPDLSRTLNEAKDKSHFLNKNNIPDLNLFLEKYKIKKSYNLGYYIHLYTDLLFYRDYMPLFIKGNLLYTDITLLDGSEITLSMEDTRDILYNDYTNLNRQVIEEYNLSLDLFYNEYIKPDTDIKEIDIKKLDILIEKMGIIIENSKVEKEYIINIQSIKAFIDNAVEEIYEDLINKKIIK